MPSEIEIGLFIIGGILAIYSLVDALFNLHEWRADKKLIRDGTETIGKITAAHTYPNVERMNSGQYCFTAEFKTPDNTIRYASSRFASTNPHRYVNTEVSIIYDPQNPDHSRFKNDISVVRELIIHVSLFIIGTILIYIAIR